MPVVGSLPSYLTPEALRQCITAALNEDLGSGDVTSQAIIPGEIAGIAAVQLRSDGVVAGLHVAAQVCQFVDPELKVTWHCEDGDVLSAGQILGTLQGPLQSLLSAERVALNFLQRMSGIATTTYQMVQAVKGYATRIRDTRKTVPGLRYLDKWAVLLGGGENHRLGLYDRMLIKDNHIAAAGSLQEAVCRAVTFGGGLSVDVEARTLDEVESALAVSSRIELVLLDNMVTVTADDIVDTSMLQTAVRLIDGRVRTEASGNVTLHSVRPIAATGVDYISCGGLTHSVQALDIGLNVI